MLKEREREREREREKPEETAQKQKSRHVKAVYLMSLICHIPFYDFTLPLPFPISAFYLSFFTFLLSFCLDTDNQMLLDELAELESIKALLDMYKLNYKTVARVNAESMSPDGEFGSFISSTLLFRIETLARPFSFTFHPLAEEGNDFLPFEYIFSPFS